jgi:hypothetical protein
MAQGESPGFFVETASLAIFIAGIVLFGLSFPLTEGLFHFVLSPGLCSRAVPLARSGGGGFKRKSLKFFGYCIFYE